MEITESISSILNHKKKQIWTADPDDTVLQAIEQMSEKNIGALPVISSDGELVGILSERDYTRKVILAGRSSRKTSVKEIMTPTPATVAPYDTVESAMHMMTDKKVRHLPVMTDGKLTGLVSIGDLVKSTISAQSAMINHLEGYIHGSYPG